jgi:hypothetical protein
MRSMTVAAAALVAAGLVLAPLEAEARRGGGHGSRAGGVAVRTVGGNFVLGARSLGHHPGIGRIFVGRRLNFQSHLLFGANGNGHITAKGGVLGDNIYVGAFGNAKVVPILVQTGSGFQRAYFINWR